MSKVTWGEKNLEFVRKTCQVEAEAQQSYWLSLLHTPQHQSSFHACVF